MLERRDIVSRISQHCQDSLFITGLGSSSYDLHAAGDSPRNFYLWGAMGGAAMTGLGLAMAQPDRRVIVLTGDGEQLMGMGALATIGSCWPDNLAIIMLDNGQFGETGKQQSHTSKGIDLVSVATACGIARAMSVTDETGFAALLSALDAQQESLFAAIKISTNSVDRSLPILDGVELKNRFRRELGLSPL
jgi:thiamine pyrophosphate-dependent acetolactate synthase large subunit-like protein